MSHRNKDDFERMVQLAEFGAKRHDENRQVEFRIFIAYMTLLVLAFYQIGKNADLGAPVGVIPGFILMHVVYLTWQIRLSIALVNDALRRNFYLKKAECLLHHLWENPGVRFCPRTDRFITIDLGTKAGEISEYELFKRHEPAVELVSSSLKIWKHWRQIWKDWSRLFQTLSPTVLLVLLILALLKQG